jgi:hypothetical protein
MKEGEMSNPLMTFLIQDEIFTLGFECGQIWEKIQAGEVFSKYAVHTKNTDQIKLIGETFGVQVEIEYVNEDWSFLTVKSIWDEGGQP